MKHVINYNPNRPLCKQKYFVSFWLPYQTIQPIAYYDQQYDRWWKCAKFNKNKFIYSGDLVLSATVSFLLHNLLLTHNANLKMTWMKIRIKVGGKWIVSMHTKEAWEWKLNVIEAKHLHHKNWKMKKSRAKWWNTRSFRYDFFSHSRSGLANGVYS